MTVVVVVVGSGEDDEPQAGLESGWQVDRTGSCPWYIIKPQLLINFVVQTRNNNIYGQITRCYKLYTATII